VVVLHCDRAVVILIGAFRVHPCCTAGGGY
jgi:hypothetical protein